MTPPGQPKTHRHIERGDDFYPTPPEAVHALLSVYQPPHCIWEPACGDGAIVNVLHAAGHHVIASDLNDWGCPDSNSRVDFLGAGGASWVPGHPDERAVPLGRAVHRTRTTAGT